MPVDIITAIGGILKIAIGLGWFSESHWPGEVDEAIDILEEAEGRDLLELREKRAYAYEMMLKHHHAEPWNKSWRLKKFQNAVQDLGRAIEEEANRFKAEREAKLPAALPSAIIEFLSKYKWPLAVGSSLIFALLIIASAGREVAK